MFRQQREQIRSTLDSVHGVPRGVLLLIATVLLMAGVLYITGTSPSTSDVALFGGESFQPVELDQVELAFSVAGLSDWRREGNQIFVPAAQRHEYLAALDGHNVLPYASHSNVHQSLSNASMFESDAALKRKLDFAKAQDLGRKIRAFGDIAWASVDYDEQEGRGFDSTVNRSASVVVFPENGKPLPQARVRMIQEFVRAAYAGLTAENVVVTDTCADESFHYGIDPQTQQRRQVEREIESKVIKFLAAYDGITAVASSGLEGERTRALRVSIGVPERHLYAQCLSARNGSVRAISESDRMAAQERLFETIRGAVDPLLNASEAKAELHLCVLPDSPEQLAKVGEAFEVSSGITRWLNENAYSMLPIAAIAVVTFGVFLATLRMRFRTSELPESVSEFAERTTVPIAEVHETGRVESGSQQAESTMREELADLIESNPELAAQIVHGWLAEAA